MKIKPLPGQHRWQEDPEAPGLWTAYVPPRPGMEPGLTIALIAFRRELASVYFWDARPLIDELLAGLTDDPDGLVTVVGYSFPDGTSVIDRPERWHFRKVAPRNLPKHLIR